MMAKAIPERLVSLCPVELNAPFGKNTPGSLQFSWVEFIHSEEFELENLLHASV